MRVVRYENRITISCTEHEFDILSIAIDRLEAGGLPDTLTETGHRRSWSRRTNAGHFLRIDKDARKDIA